jgi:hypothetical protein
MTTAAKESKLTSPDFATLMAYGAEHGDAEAQEWTHDFVGRLTEQAIARLAVLFEQHSAATALSVLADEMNDWGVRNLDAPGTGDAIVRLIAQAAVEIRQEGPR